MSRRKQKDDTLELDQIFAGRERVLVCTFWLQGLNPDHRLYMTTVVGPGARDEAVDTAKYSYWSEAAARAGHEEMLASYGYRKTGLRRWKFFRQLEYFGKGIVNVSFRPPSRKSAWVMASFWTFALIWPVGGILWGAGFTLYNAVVGSLDAFMLYASVTGLRWSYRRQPVPDTLGG